MARRRQWALIRALQKSNKERKARAEPIKLAMGGRDRWSGDLGPDTG